MNKNQVTGILLAGLLVMLLCTSLAGCGGQRSGQLDNKDRGPFYVDRVVTARIVMSETDWEFLKKNARSEQYVKADMWYDGKLIPDIAVRPKGNSSLMTAARTGTTRLPLKVDLNFFNSARNLGGVKKLSFNNGFSDPTLIREVLAYELFEQMDIPTPRASFVDLWVNDAHLGLYTMVEQIDKTFLNNHFADSTGNLYKPQRSAAYLKWTEKDLQKQQASEASTASKNQTDQKEINLGGGNLAQIMQALESPKTANTGNVAPFPNAPPGMPPPGGMAPGGMATPPGMPWNQSGNLLELMGLKTNENKPNHSLLFRLLDILNNEPNETLPAEIEKVLDVDEVLRFLAVSAVIIHLDNYIGRFGHNYYLYEADGKFTIIPWDLNMAFGTFNSGLDRQGIINFFIDEPTAGPVADRPLVSRLLSVPSYLETYHRYITELINAPFSQDVMNSRIDKLASLIRPYVANDNLKFYSAEDFETGLSKDVKPTMGPPGGMTPIGLKTFVTERLESVKQQLEGKKPSKSTDGKGNGGGNMMFGPPSPIQGGAPLE